MAGKEKLEQGEAQPHLTMIRTAQFLSIYRLELCFIYKLSL